MEECSHKSPLHEYTGMRVFLNMGDIGQFQRRSVRLLEIVQVIMGPRLGDNSRQPGVFL